MLYSRVLPSLYAYKIGTITLVCRVVEIYGPLDYQIKVKVKLAHPYFYYKAPTDFTA